MNRVPLRAALCLLCLVAQVACQRSEAPCACAEVHDTLLSGGERAALARLERVRRGEGDVVAGCELAEWWPRCGGGILAGARRRGLGPRHRAAQASAAAGRGSPERGPTLAELLVDSAPAPRREAVWAATRLAPELLHEQATSLLRDPSPSVREATAEGVATLRIPGAERALVAAFLSAADPASRAPFERALVAVRATPTLRAELERLGASAPVHLVVLLADLDDGPAILTALRHPAAAIRQIAAGAAGRLRLHEAVEPLLLLAESPEPGLRSAAEASLARLARPTLAPTFVAWLDSPDPDRVRSACQALAALPSDPSGPPALLKVLGHPEPDVRLAAAAALARVGDEAALTPLLELSKADPDSGRRRRLTELHRRLFRRLRRLRRAAVAKPNDRSPVPAPPHGVTAPGGRR